MKLLEGQKFAELKLGQNSIVGVEVLLLESRNFWIVVGMKLLEKKRLLKCAESYWKADMVEEKGL